MSRPELSVVEFTNTPRVSEASCVKSTVLSGLFTASPFASLRISSLPSALGIRITDGFELSPIPAMKSGILSSINSEITFLAFPVSSSPSLKSTTARLSPSAPFLNASSAVSSAEAIFVPPVGIVSALSESTTETRLEKSFVSGETRNDVPANATRPNLSAGKDFMISRMSHFSCSSLVGRTSSAYMLLETSATNITSRPAAVSGSISCPHAGRAAAITASTAAVRRRMCLMTRFVTDTSVKRRASEGFAKIRPMRFFLIYAPASASKI